MKEVTTPSFCEIWTGLMSVGSIPPGTRTHLKGCFHLKHPFFIRVAVPPSDSVPTRVGFIMLNMSLRAAAVWIDEHLTTFTENSRAGGPNITQEKS